MTIDFLIVGGGIGGAVLANLLSHHGKTVVVLERALTPARRTRPEILWPATVHVLQSLIPKSQDDAWRLPLAGVVVTQSRQTLLNVAQATFTDIGVQPNSTDPSQTRQQLLSQGNFEVRHGIEVTDVLKEDDRVVGVLSAYEQRRRPANRRSIAISQRTARLLSLPGFLLDLVFPVAVRWINHKPIRLRRPLRYISTAFQ